MAQNVVINGVTYSNVPEVDIPKSGGGTSTFYDSSDATAAAGDVLTGKSFYKSGGKANGSMANNGDTSGDITTKEGTVTIPAGYTSGGTVGIASAQKANIVSGNIKSGATILGVAGSSMVVDTTIASDGAAASDIMSGKKGYVNGALVTGTASVPTISQDATTKILTIS